MSICFGVDIGFDISMLTIWNILVGLTGLVGLAYIFLTWNFNYWQKRGIKTAKSWPFVGSFPSLFTQRRNVTYDIDDMYRQYKQTENVVGVMNTRIPQLLVLSPEYARRIFVNDFRNFHDNEMHKFTNNKVDRILANNPFILTGEEWKERRAEITPGLSTNRVSAVYPVTQSVCTKFVEYIRSQRETAQSNGLNAKQICLCYTTEVVADCVLGIKAQSFTDQPTPLVGMIRRVFEQSFGFIFYSTIANLWPRIRSFYSVPLFAKDVETFFFDLFESAINLRRQNSQGGRQDFINYMLQLQEKKKLNNFELASHTMTFLTDGFETTALVLAHTLLLIARNPETQQKLRSQLEEATEQSSNISFEQLSELPYLNACIHETLRLFPPLLAGRKVVTEPFEFINKNGQAVKVVPGDVVIVPVYSIHHDEEYYEQPESFIPERFLDSEDMERQYRERGLYFGFGDGPRICLGMRFALTQLKAALAKTVLSFNIKVHPRTRKDNQLDDTYFMATLKGGIWLDFEPR